MKRIQLVLLLLLSVAILFPSVVSTQGSVVFTGERVSNLPVTQQDQGVLGIQNQSSIQVGSSSEKLVEIQNQLNVQQDVSVILENAVDWSFGGGVKTETKTINPSNNKSYFVETNGVSASNADYTIRGRNGSFIFETTRTVQFANPSFTLTVGGDSNKALISSSDNDGEVLRVDGNFIYPGGTYTYSSNNSVVSVNETANCSGNQKNKGSCPVYVDPASTGDSLVTVTDGSGSSNSILVRVTTAPFFVEVKSIKEPVAGQGRVKIEVRAVNNGSATSTGEIRVDPEFAQPKTKSYTISTGNERTKTYSFSTQSGDSGTYTAIANLFENGGVGGKIIDSSSKSYTILSSSGGLKLNGFSIANTNGKVNESETIRFDVSVENTQSSQVTDTITIGNSSIGSNSKSVTLSAGQSKSVRINISTRVGSRGQYKFEATSSSSRVINDVKILRSVPFISNYQITGLSNGNRNVTHTFQTQSVNNANISDVRLNVSVNGTQQRSVLLVDNGVATQNGYGGSLQVEPQQVQVQNDISVNVGFNLKSGGGGNTVKSTLIVRQDDGFEKINTTTFTN